MIRIAIEKARAGDVQGVEDALEFAWTTKTKEARRAISKQVLQRSAAIVVASAALTISGLPPICLGLGVFCFWAILGFRNYRQDVVSGRVELETIRKALRRTAEKVQKNQA